jgi:hypothetical protein
MLTRSIVLLQVVLAAAAFSAAEAAKPIVRDDAPEPAVLCPLPDFFGDGANGKSAHFASSFVEKVPEAWNAYFPMPFAKSARVVIRNDTDVDTAAYAYLE